MSKKIVKDNRTRNWVFIAYAENLAPKWRDILTDEGLTWARSPLHDKDIDEDAEGGPKPKKPHYHFILKFPGSKSREQIQEIADKVNPPHAPQVLPCGNIVGSVRYFVHRDHPDKYQYSEADICEGGGFDVATLLALTPTQERSVVVEMLKYCRANGIDELCDLEDVVLDEKEEWHSVFVMYNATLWRCLNSRRCKNDRLRGA